MSSWETHACLLSSKTVHTGSYRFTGKARTIRQLRSTPNQWETAWVFWNYTDNDHLYYFVLKTNGWEIGKRHPQYIGPNNDGQLIMRTGSFPKTTIGVAYKFDIQVNEAGADIYVDDVLVHRFIDDSASPKFTQGNVCLYSEDAEVEFDGISAPFVDNFDEPLKTLADGSSTNNWIVQFLGFGSGGIVVGNL
jgi:hypothetical protein